MSWRRALAVRAAPAERPGDQQQEEEYAERENSKGPGRNRQVAGRLSLEERQSQGHTRSVAARNGGWLNSSVRYCLTWPDPVTTYLVEVISGRPMGPRACSFCVDIPISALNPNSPPSTNRLEALTSTAAASTSA